VVQEGRAEAVGSSSDPRQHPVTQPQCPGGLEQAHQPTHRGQQRLRCVLGPLSDVLVKGTRPGVSNVLCGQPGDGQQDVQGNPQLLGNMDLQQQQQQSIDIS